MRNDEDVNDYCHRVEKLYYKLCTACTLNKEEAEARVIHETLKEQTLNIFIKGLISPIKTIIKSRNPKVAKQLAKAEEVEYNSERENNRYRNEFNNKGNYNFSRPNNNNFQRTNNTRNNNMNSLINHEQPIILNKIIQIDHLLNVTTVMLITMQFNVEIILSRTSNRKNFTQPPTNYNARVSTCAYCKRGGHDINVCKRNDENRNNNVSGEERGTRNAQCYHIVAAIENNQITCISPASKTKELNLLVDTGSQVNILKIDCLQGQLIIYETQKINLRGIHEELIQTIGRISIPIIITNKNIDTEFYVVGMQFPILKDGILGHEFLLKNKVMVDVANNRLIILNDETTLRDACCSSVVLTLHPRTETIVEIAIADPVVESKSIYIHKQQITNDVYFSSTVSTVNEGKAVV
ncbi:Uncharacterized protein FWK35_00034540, partial [Aphis craccivora]